MDSPDGGDHEMLMHVQDLRQTFCKGAKLTKSPHPEHARTTGREFSDYV